MRATIDLGVLCTLLLFYSPTHAQTPSILGIGTITTFPPANSPTTTGLTPPLYVLPVADVLTISIALCAGDTQGAALPRFFVTNSSSVDVPRSTDDSGNTFEIMLDQGVGQWGGVFIEGGRLAVETNGVVNIAANIPFEIGVSGDLHTAEKLGSGAIHQNVDPYTVNFGDSSATQALLYSYQVITPTLVEPTYPNYTLPAPIPDLPAAPVAGVDYTLPQLIVVETTQTNITSLFQSSCRLRKVSSVGTVTDTKPWYRDEDGWRQQWMVEGLNPGTNYTMYTVQGGLIAGPAYFITKSSAFACPLVHSLSFCPSVTYAVPLPAPQLPFTSYNSTNLPASMTTPLLSHIANLTTNVLTMGCGRDQYSLLVSCAICQREYRRWMCAVSFPRCGELRPGDTMPVVAAPTKTIGRSAKKTPVSDNDAQVILSALVAEPTIAKSSALGADAWPAISLRDSNGPLLANGYQQLQPCLERCTSADRACPYFLGFVCPYIDFNAAASYGVGYVDSGQREGGEGTGLIGNGWGKGILGNGGPQGMDKYGNVWCNWG